MRKQADMPILFQSTHSLRSATGRVSHGYMLSRVSIHALLAECDISSKYFINQFVSFNPRTPCGVRQEHNPESFLFLRFQSTHSLRSATRMTPGSTPDTKFQSTHSLRSATQYKHRRFFSRQFQSTHSLRSATKFDIQLVKQGIVSIHALLAECDISPVGRIAHTAVSIHALLAECDPYRLPQHNVIHSFNPRTPCGVRPTVCAFTPSSKSGFNPRTPCGVRPVRLQIIGADRDVSIHALLAECDGLGWR